MPSALAVLRLTASSNLVGCCAGKLAGFAPFRELTHGIGVDCALETSGASSARIAAVE